MKVTLDDGRVLELPVIHCMVMGTENSGKSEFSASAEKPILVFACDPQDKLHAYFNQGIVDPKIYTGEQGQPIRLVKSRKTGNVVVQIECYYDEDENNPIAMEQLIRRLPKASEDIKQGRFKTWVWDTWTQLEWIARLRRKHGPMSIGVDSPYFAAMDDLQSIAHSRIMHAPCNVIVTFHVETKVVKNRKGEVVKDARQDAGGGELTYGIQAIGQLKTLGRIFGECYLTSAPVDGSDNYQLITRKNYDFKTLDSRIKAPNPCPNKWQALFGPWIEAHKDDAVAPDAMGANGEAAALTDRKES